MYDNKFLNSNIVYDYTKISDKQDVSNLLKSYLEEYFDINNDKEVWFNKIKDLAEKYGYAREVKEYKQNPDKFPGHVGDVSTVLRVALTGRQNTPDMYEIMQVLGKESVIKRLKQAMD